MTQIKIQSLLGLYQAVYGHYKPTEWVERQAELNPWNDKFLTRLQTMRYSILMEYQARAMPEMKKVYWRTRSLEDQMIAEGEAEYYEDLYKNLCAAEVCYIRDTYLDAELQSLGDSEIPMDLPTHSIEKRLTKIAETRYGVINSLVPPSSPCAVEYESAVLNDSDLDAWVERWEYMPTIHAPSYEQSLSWVQHELIEAWSILGSELSIAGRAKNQLTGVAGKSRFLLTNHDIPLPTPDTFAAWSNLCSMEFVRLDKSDQHYLRAFGNPEWLLTLASPMIAVTKEHVSGGMMQTDDSHANHSLPARSAGHARNEYGRIQHGIADVSTFLLNRHGVAAQVASEKLTNSAVSHLMLNHRGMLPVKPNTLDNVWTRRVSGNAIFNLSSVFADPYMNGNHPVPFNWPHMAMRIDTPWRALAKEHNLYLRFDSTPIGAEACIEWQDAFINCAIQLASSTPDQITGRRLTSTVEFIHHEVKKSEAVQIARGAINTRFDFSGLN